MYCFDFAQKQIENGIPLATAISSWPHNILIIIAYFGRIMRAFSFLEYFVIIFKISWRHCQILDLTRLNFVEQS